LIIQAIQVIISLLVKGLVKGMARSKGKGTGGRKGKGGRAHSLRQPPVSPSKSADNASVQNRQMLAAEFGRRNVSVEEKLQSGMTHRPLAGTAPGEVPADREIQAQTGGQVKSVQDAFKMGLARNGEELKRNSEEIARTARSTFALTSRVTRDIPGPGDEARPIAASFRRSSGLSSRQIGASLMGGDFRNANGRNAGDQFSSRASRGERSRTRDSSRNRQHIQTQNREPNQPKIPGKDGRPSQQQPLN
jgi:hypothetical protein